MIKVVKFGGSSLQAQSSLRRLATLSVPKRAEDMLCRLHRESVFQRIRK